MRNHIVNPDQGLIANVQPVGDAPTGNALNVSVAGSGSNPITVVGPLTDAELRAIAVEVIVTNEPSVNLQDGAGNDLTSTVNDDRTTNLDGLRGLNTNAMLFGRVSDTVVKNARLDASTESQMITDYEHHEIHAGTHFFLDRVVTLPINNVYDVQITTPNTAKWSHLTFTMSDEAETEWYLYEDVSIVTAGTTITPNNNNRNSANLSTLTIASITNSNVSNADADTDTTGSLELVHGITGAGRDAGRTSRGHEIILKQNTNYCFRFIANAAGYVNYNLQWYEHTNRN